MMAYLKMKRMRKLPIEKLSYHLKLELLENMEPGDVIELVNVNQGFRSMVVREPWQIFGKHVDSLCIQANGQLDAKSIWIGSIRKFEFGMDYNYDRHEFFRCVTILKSYSTLFSKIRS